MRSLWLLICLSFAARAQNSATSGTFVLHKFARANGQEHYSIAQAGDTYTLRSKFLFTDRGMKVPLETTFTAKTQGMTPVAYSAKGMSSRQSKMEDAVTVDGDRLTITRGGKKETVAAAGVWFVTDGYSPVAMQEQMMRWWLAHDRPAEFTVYPAKALVQIVAVGPLQVGGKTMQGYTVAGLIWGEESLWMDDAQNLTALVSTDAEFDHFEAVRSAYETSLGTFIAAAVKADLAALGRLSATARMPRSRRMAITGATLVDSTGAPAVADSVIVIEDGVIKSAGKRGQVDVPSDATVLDATGKWAVPGLWDMHAHYEQVEWGPIYLAAGVTTARDVGNEFDFIRTVHDELDRAENPAIGPHLEFAGIIDGKGPRAIGDIIADTPQQAVAWVEKYKAAGARQIKIYSSVKPPIVKAIAEAAHARGMTVTGHIPIGIKAMDGIAAGMDQINHLPYVSSYFANPVTAANGKPDPSKPPTLDLDGDRAKQIIAALKEHHTVLDPTVVIYELFAHTGPLEDVEPGVTHLPPQLKEAIDGPPVPAGRKAMVERQQEIREGALRRLHAAGIPIVAGTDQAVPGYSLHRELELYVKAGFTPLEALKAATIEAARAIGCEREAGSLEVGKRADVLLLDADPISDIRNTRRIWRTVAGGVVYEPGKLWAAVGFLP
jgi:imidazolonepropionase-like amidohydrolase